MDIISTAAVCLTVCAVSALLKENGDIRLALTAVTVGIILSGTMGYFSEIKALAEELFDVSGLDDTYMKILLKAFGISTTAKLSSDCCRDNGQSALGTQIELVGRLSIAVLSLPMFRAVTEIIGTLLS
ncbi:MAG: hypothetical protein IJ555_13570 [Ruminococcus sp.]|nr:hypothetical protein [Ruminococcus sp.]